MKAIALLVPMILLAGCTQFDDAQRAAEDAKIQLDEARQDAQEAKERYERVKSATIVRTERIDLKLSAKIANGTVRFDPNATRAGVSIQDENLERLPPLVLEGSGFRVTCDPLACSAELPEEGILLSWADDADGGMRLVLNAQCDTDADGTRTCALPWLSREGVEAGVTSRVGDVTS